jgi:GTP-binding protein HflX
VELDVAHGDGATLAWLYAHGEVVDRSDDDSHAHLRVAIEPATLARMAHLGQDHVAA